MCATCDTNYFFVLQYCQQCSQLLKDVSEQTPLVQVVKILNLSVPPTVLRALLAAGCSSNPPDIGCKFRLGVVV